MPESQRPDLLVDMYPAELPWIATETGAQVQVGQLGLLIVRKVKIDFSAVIFGKELQARSITIEEGKERAELAARRWVAQAGAILWSKEPPVPPMPRQTYAHPGGISRKAKV